MKLKLHHQDEPKTLTDSYYGDITVQSGYTMILSKKTKSGKFAQIALNIPDELGEQIKAAESALDQSLKNQNKVE